MDIAKLQEKASSASGLLKVLASESRLLILCQLIEGEKSVNQLEELVGMRQSALSQHLARMREENIVGFRRSAQTLYYRVTDPRILKILATLKSIYC